MSDVVATPVRERTYRVPRTVQEAVAASGFVASASALHSVTTSLLDGAVTETQIDEITNIPVTQASEIFGDDTVLWASRIQQTIADNAEASTLRKINYSDEPGFVYYGVETAVDSDILNKLVRSRPEQNSDGFVLESMSVDGSWQPFAPTPGETAVETDKTLTAALGQAILEGCDGLYLSYAEPVMFLRTPNFIEESPLVAAIDPNRDYIYAIVDAADTTAVIDAIKIEPGPIVYRRDNAQWTRDETLLDTLLSASPPPLVELSDDLVKDVLSQIDSSKSNHLDVGPDGQSYGGSKLEELEKSNAPKQRARGHQVNSPSVAPVGVTAAIEQRYTDIMHDAFSEHSALVASAHLQYSEDATIPLNSTITAAANARELAVAQARIQRVNALIQRRQELESRDALLTIVAASNSASAKARGQASAERLRQYWLYGKGALKIKWGVSGDWRRCYRHLRKYLGVRAKGYCQLMHKRATGMYTGDKRNR